MSNDNDTKLAIAIADLNNKLETLLQRQEEVADNIAKIKEAIYHPDQGLFTRIRELELWKNNFLETFEERIKYHSVKDGELRLSQVETTISALKRIQWLIIGSAVTTITGLIIKFFVLK
jgi:chromosome segregation ATPase